MPTPPQSPDPADEVIYIDEDALARPEDFYLLLVVDDNEDVHAATRLTLKDARINGRRLETLHAYSGEEAKRFIEHGIPFDLVLLDMVMETDDAGLRVAKFIQSFCGHKPAPAIVMRTGQPGQFKDQDVTDCIWFDEFVLKSSATRSHLFDVLTERLSATDQDGLMPL